jgi:hypothetical protein
MQDFINGLIGNLPLFAGILIGGMTGNFLSDRKVYVSMKFGWLILAAALIGIAGAGYFFSTQQLFISELFIGLFAAASTFALTAKTSASDLQI